MVFVIEPAIWQFARYAMMEGQLFRFIETRRFLETSFYHTDFRLTLRCFVTGRNYV